MCLANELFYCALYLNYFTNNPVVLGIPLLRAVAAISAPFALLKTFISLVHGYVACLNIVALDSKDK